MNQFSRVRDLEAENDELRQALGELIRFTAVLVDVLARPPAPVLRLVPKD